MCRHLFLFNIDLDTEIENWDLETSKCEETIISYTIFKLYVSK